MKVESPHIWWVTKRGSTWLNSDVRLALKKQSNIRLIVTNTLSYYATEWIMTVKSFTVQLSYLIFSFFNDSRLLAPKYSEYFTWSAPPTLNSWSGSLIGSAYFSLYINFCFGFNKTLTNLTLLRQHHLQYTSTHQIYYNIQHKLVENQP